MQTMQMQSQKLKQQQLAGQKRKQQVQSPKLQQQSRKARQQQQQKSRLSLKQPRLQTHLVQLQLRPTISSRPRKRRRGLHAPAALAGASGRQQSLPQPKLLRLLLVARATMHRHRQP
jgi:hypothetical protein